jgi:predicted anti-sigma-YlaC factor YlaD
LAEARREQVMDQQRSSVTTRDNARTDTEPRRRSGHVLAGIGRFLLGSILLMAGSMLALSGAITIVGLPLGLIVLAVGLDLLLARR